jgi:hypothetical protein
MKARSRSGIPSGWDHMAAAGVDRDGRAGSVNEGDQYRLVTSNAVAARGNQRANLDGTRDDNRYLRTSVLSARILT